MASSRPKLFLHAGTHKTGTTAIQKFAARYRAALKRQGTLYPEYTGFGNRNNQSHLGLFHALAGDERAVPYNSLGELVAIWADQARESRSNVLLSAEALWRHQIRNGTDGWAGQRRAYLAQVGRLLDAFDVHVILVLRNQDEFINSLYRENVMKGIGGGKLAFGEFARRQLQSTLRYWDNISMFQEVFGSTVILLYDDLKTGDGLFINFFNEIGVDANGLTSVGTGRPSLSTPQAMVKRYLDQTSSMSHKAQLSLARDGRLARRLTKEYSPDVEFWESKEQKEQFVSEFTDENESIRKAWFPERECLFEYRPFRCSVGSTPSKRVVRYLKARVGDGHANDIRVGGWSPRSAMRWVRTRR